MSVVYGEEKKMSAPFHSSNETVVVDQSFRRTVCHESQSDIKVHTVISSARPFFGSIDCLIFLVSVWTVRSNAIVAATTQASHSPLDPATSTVLQLIIILFECGLWLWVTKSKTKYDHSDSNPVTTWLLALTYLTISYYSSPQIKIIK